MKGFLIFNLNFFLKKEKKRRLKSKSLKEDKLGIYIKRVDKSREDTYIL
jgi:hypothetical protein